MAFPRSPGTVVAAHHLRARLRFRHLELLVTLGEQPSLHKASAALAMTQPAASKLLREIEVMLGVLLFERSRQGIAPTAAGVALIGHARLMLGLLDGARDEIVAIVEGSSARIRIGVAAVAAPVLLPTMHKLLAANAPGVVLSVREGGPELLTELRSGKLDCVIGRIIDGDEGVDLTVEPLYDESIVIVARPGHELLSRSGKLLWEDALQHEWILPPEGAPVRRVLQAWFTRNRMRMPPCRLESLSVIANVALTRASDALALLPSRVASYYADLGQLQVLRLSRSTPFPPLPSVALMQRHGDPPTSGMQAVVAAALTAARPHRARAKASPRRNLVRHKI